MALITEEYTQVGGITTSVVKCGSLSESNILALIIPGNPGVAQYYHKFMETLHGASGARLPLWCVSHAGHGYVPNFTCTNKNPDLFGLQGQIQHKVSFVKEHIPRDTKLILIGHSIGCYIILNMLQDIDADRVVKCLLLFPTIERMAQSSSGRRATPFLYYLRWFAPLPMYPVSYFMSSSLKDNLLRWYFKDRKVPESAVAATKRLANPFTIRNVTHMANQEMQTVIEADYKIIKENLSKLMFYYGASDHWCPVEYYEDMKAKFPDGDIMLCKKGFAHAFVLEDSEAMAELLWKWLQANVRDTGNGFL